ncbi:unnamed protein product [Didymodactylos carnosus]|uniref:COX assembly mitochondrial protein n=1 Tax=Didymodactylos carnosus TaxID=1234261 RepID=A0A815G4M9_9BILA|nr:unnamed protein product [Didymodactylos carnosus]CAF4189993.1 unnamed protein product [Didymodactylos carnosus]
MSLCSFEISNYLKFKYDMIHSESSNTDDYWYSNETCRCDDGKQYPCQEIYFKKNTDIPIKTVEVVRQGWNVVQRTTTYDIISIGDLDDKSLRHVGLEVCIPQIVRDRGHPFGKCSEEHGGFMAVFKCRKELKQMNDCLTKWFQDEEFRKECIDIYLDERTKYRSTGEVTHQIKRPYYYNPEKELKRLSKLKEKYDRLENKT